MIRKAIWLTVASLIFVPHIICYAAAELDERIYALGSKMYVWSHADKFTRIPR